MQVEGHPCLKDPKSAGAVEALCGEVEGLPMLVPSDSACWGGHLWRLENILPTGNCGYHSRVEFELREDLSQAPVSQAP